MANEELAEVQVTETPEQPSEKMLSQDEVNRIVGEQKKRAAQRERERVEAEFQQRMQEMQSQASNSMGGIAPSEEEIYNKVYSRLQNELQKQAEAQEQQRYQQEMERIANDYHTKMAGGQDLYDDFADVTKEFQPAAFPRAVYLASMMDNTPAVMYELVKNPSKLTTIENVAERDPNMAQRMLAQIATSIKENEQAKQQAEQQQTNSPLSRMTPSPVGSDNGAMSIRDFKKASWLRG